MIFLLTIFILAIQLPDNADSVAIPPKITKQSPRDIYYRPGYYVKIECEAYSIPAPNYYWQRAGTTYTPSGNDQRVVQMNGFGTLLINAPEDKDEGLYQCFAENDFGVTMTHMFNLRMARLDPFANREQKKDIWTVLGGHVRMDCQTPASVPDGEVYWKWRLSNGMQQIVDVDERLTIDLEDRLHITEVMHADFEEGRHYFCVVKNTIMQAEVYGPAYRVRVPSTGVAVDAPMTLQYPQSADGRTALVGNIARLKCIYSGNPVPFVHWQRVDSNKNISRRAITLSRGQELLIRNVQPEDAGTYQCSATQEKVSAPMKFAFPLTVLTAPYWIVKPQDVDIFEEGTAEIECTGFGSKISIDWFVNSVPLEVALRINKRLDNRFQKIQSNKILFERLTLKDTMVFQCNISNHDGYIYAEARLSILAAPPSILVKPQDTLKVAEGRPFTLTCTVAGTPNVTWYRDDELITGGRYSVKKSGDLFVQSAVLTDAGHYRCIAVNKWGMDQAIGSLIVRRPTLIVQWPIDIEVRQSVNAKFICSGTTDPEEVENLTLDWYKDGKKIEHTATLSPRTFINKQDNSLTISGAEQRDTGYFTCVVSNGLDNDTASARLVVTDLPDRATRVTVNNSCSDDGTAEVHWMPGSFNNAPIQYFLIEFRTGKDPNHWVFAQKVPYTRAMAIIPIPPGLTYFFRVTAYNKNGQSEASDPSVTQCSRTNKVERPSVNPTNVRTIGNIYGRLYIEWTPVLPQYHGDESSFGYRVTVQAFGEVAITPYEVNDWLVSSLNISHGGVPYHPYHITVRSLNSKGLSSVDPVSVVGHAYEAMPQINPTNLQVSDIESDGALFTWEFLRTEIGIVDSKIQGEFRGFKIQVWQENKQGETIRNWDVGPDQFRPNGTDKEFSTFLKGLLPNTHLEARVSLLNNFYVSAPSDVTKFTTIPGLPGPVDYMEEANVGDTHINFQWTPPLDNRGDIIGYDMGYQEVKGLELGDMEERDPQIDDPYATNAMLNGLKPHTKYRIHIWARTAQGRGEGFFIERATRAALDPLIPRFTISGVGPDFINVTWWSDAYKDSGTVVFVEYMKEDGREWISTTPNVAKDWVLLNLLQPGMTYYVRVVSTNGITRRLSGEEEVTTDGLAAAYDVASNVGWFVALILAILFEIGLVIIFVACYRRGFRFKSRGRPVRTYKDGDNTFTGTFHNKTAIPQASSDFGLEPLGYNNDYYSDREDEHRDFARAQSTGFEVGSKENQYNEDWNRSGYDKDPDYPYDDDYNGRVYDRDEKAQRRTGAYSNAEYEDYEQPVDGPNFRPPPADAAYDNNDRRDRYYDDYDDQRDRYDDRYDRDDYHRDDYDHDRSDSDRDYNRRYDTDDDVYDRRYRRDYEDDRYDDREDRYDARRHRQDDEAGEDHECGNPDPNHDHSRCRSVVDEYQKRYSGEHGQSVRPSSQQTSGSDLGIPGTTV